MFNINLNRYEHFLKIMKKKALIIRIIGNVSEKNYKKIF